MAFFSVKKAISQAVSGHNETLERVTAAAAAAESLDTIATLRKVATTAYNKREALASLLDSATEVEGKGKVALPLLIQNAQSLGLRVTESHLAKYNGHKLLRLSWLCQSIAGKALQGEFKKLIPALFRSPVTSKSIADLDRFNAYSPYFDTAKGKMNGNTNTRNVFVVLEDLGLIEEYGRPTAGYKLCPYPEGILERLYILAGRED